MNFTRINSNTKLSNKIFKTCLAKTFTINAPLMAERNADNVRHKYNKRTLYNTKLNLSLQNLNSPLGA